MYRENGLPNITGVVNGSREENIVASGAFKASSETSEPVYGQGAYRERSYTFDASRCSTIYGNSSVVQPASLTMRCYIKY